MMIERRRNYLRAAAFANFDDLVHTELHVRFQVRQARALGCVNIHSSLRMAQDQCNTLRRPTSPDSVLSSGIRAEESYTN